MTREDLLEALSDAEEDYIDEAMPKALSDGKETSGHPWLKWAILAAAVLIAIGVGIWRAQRTTSSLEDNVAKESHPGEENALEGSKKQGEGLIGCNIMGDIFRKECGELPAPHGEEISPVIDSELLKTFEGRGTFFKFYELISDGWYFSDELTDFSQVITKEEKYVAWQGVGKKELQEYYVYVADNGRVREIGKAPALLTGNLVDLVEKNLQGMEYEDYVVTYDSRLQGVFFWVRRTGEEDLMIPYFPWEILQTGEPHTLAELKIALQNAADGNYEPFELAYGTKKEHINSYLDIQMTLNSMENFSSLKLKNIRVGYQIENDPAKQLKEIEVESQNQFEKDTGISTRQLLALYQLGEKKDLKKRWENQKFYLLFDETERDSEKPERNLTHDYVLVWKREDNQGVAKVSFCGFEEPLRDYVVSVSEPVLSLFGNTQVLIYGDADQQAYVAQFTIRDCYVDVECRNVSEEEFKVFLWKLTQILEDESNQ